MEQTREVSLHEQLEKLSIAALVPGIIRTLDLALAGDLKCSIVDQNSAIGGSSEPSGEAKVWLCSDSRIVQVSYAAAGSDEDVNNPGSLVVTGFSVSVRSLSGLTEVVLGAPKQRVPVRASDTSPSSNPLGAFMPDQLGLVFSDGASWTIATGTGAARDSKRGIAFLLAQL